MSTTLHNQLKTNLGMPLQSQALEAPAADSLRVSTKRASACNTMQHCQEERTHNTVPSLPQGFRTGDHVKAIVTKGKKQGTYTGRIAVRKSGSFNIQTTTATIQGISFKSCHLLQRADGYQYNNQRDSTTT